MRKHFLTTLIAGLAGVVFSATSCDPAESTPDPVFPDFVEKTVAAGETVELSFSANQDWTVSIPADEAGTYFRLTDGSKQSFAVKGEAGDHTVSVVVIGEQDFENHELTVSMTMGDRTEDIAKITLPALERSMSISRAVFNADKTDFATGEDGSYEYEQIAADSEIELIWPASISLADDPYRNYLHIDASVEWSVTEKPDWLNISPSSGAGSSDITLSCNYSELSVEEGVELNGKISISGEGIETASSFNIVVPSAYGLTKFIGMPEDGLLTFSPEGYFTGRGDGSEFFAQAMSGEPFVYYFWMPVQDNIRPGQNVGYADEIFTITGGWEESVAGLQLYNLSIVMKPNDSENVRSGKLLAVPQSVVDADEYLSVAPVYLTDLVEGGNGDIRPQFEQYIIADFTQEGKQVEELGFTPSDDFLALVEEGKASFIEFQTFDEMEPEEQEQYGSVLEMGGKVYRVTYNHPDAEGSVFNVSGELGRANLNPYGTTWLYIPESEVEMGYYVTLTSDEISVYMNGTTESVDSSETSLSCSLDFMSDSGETIFVIIFVKNY